MEKEYNIRASTSQVPHDGLLVICENGLRKDRSSASQNVVNYSGLDSELVTGYESYNVRPVVEKRAYPRIPCRNVKACIKTKQGERVVVDLISISRDGVCFISFAAFTIGTLVSIATHYVEGGENIYQEGRINRVWHKPSEMLPSEYAIEFELYVAHCWITERVIYAAFP